MIKLISIFFALLLLGCQQKGDPQGEISDGFNGGFVSTVTLKDGTVCAVLIGTYKGGIDCNWSNSK